MNVMVSASHTHTGGPLYNSFESLQNDQYIAYFVEKTADSAILAFQNRKAVRLGFGLGTEADIIFNRRYIMKNGSIVTNPGINNPDVESPAGPVDPDVGVIRIDDMEGNPVGAVVNYACHASTVNGTEFSGDYIGALSADLKRFYGENFITVFILGACGDINHKDIRGKIVTDQLYYKKIGRILAGEVIKVREKIRLFEEVDLDLCSSSMTFGIRQPSDEDVAQAKAIIESPDSARNDKILANELLKVLEDPDKEAELELQTIKIGSICIVGFPVELFASLGLLLKEKSPFECTFVNTLCNGREGYLPPESAFNRGGYETTLSRVSKLETGAGEAVLEETLSLLNKLKRRQHAKNRNE
jgi:hypothetical protein